MKHLRYNKAKATSIVAITSHLIMLNIMKNKGNITDWSKSSINERIACIVEQFFEGNASKMAEAIDVKQSTIRDIIGTRKNRPSFETMEQIVSNATLNISSEWLLTGEGSMYNILNEPLATYGKTGSPYYDVDFIGGFDVLTNDITINPEYLIDLPPYNKDGVIWCNLYGQSMEPYIMSGDKIAIRQVLIEDVIFGKPYGIITNSGLRTVKWVTRSPDEKCYRLVPENKDPRFGDYQDIPKVDIYKMFLVMGSIRAL